MGQKYRCGLPQRDGSFLHSEIPWKPETRGHTGYMIYNLSWWHPAVRIEWEAEPSDLIIHQGKKDDEKETTVKFWVHSSQGKQTEIHINLLPFQRKDGKYLREVLFQWVNSLGQWADPTKYDVEVGYEVFLGAVRSFIL